MMTLIIAPDGITEQRRSQKELSATIALVTLTNSLHVSVVVVDVVELVSNKPDPDSSYSSSLSSS